MDSVLWLFMLLGVLILVSPFVALVWLFRLSRRLDLLEQGLARLETALAARSPPPSPWQRRTEAARDGSGPAATSARPVPPPAAPSDAAAPPAAPPPADGALPEAGPPAAAGPGEAAAPDGRRPDGTSPATDGPDAARPEAAGPDTTGPDTSGPDTSGPDTSGPDTSGPESGGPLPDGRAAPDRGATGPADTPPPAAPPPPRRWEEQLAARWMVWLGGLTVALAAVFLFRYAIDQGWLTPFARVTAGLLLGGALLGLGEWTQRAPVSLGDRPLAPDHVPPALSAAGIFAILASLYAAHGLYGLMGPVPAFAAMALTVWSALGLSLRQGWFVAALGLVAGYLVPLLIVAEEPSAPATFLYLFVLTLGALGLMVWRRWRWFAVLALAGALAWPWLWALGPATPGDRLVLGLYAVGLAAAFGALSVRLPLPAPDRPAWRWLAATLTETAGLGFALTGGLLIHLAMQAGFDAASLAFLLAHGAVALGLGLWQPRREGLFPVAALIGLVAMLIWPAATGLPAPPSVEAGAARSGWPFGLPQEIALYARGLWALAVLFGLGGFLALGRVTARPVWAGVSALLPVALFALGYARIAGFEVSTDWAALAVGLALAQLAAATALRRRMPPADGDVPVGFHAAGVTAAVALAFACVLREAWLSVALAAEVAALGWLWTRLRVAALRTLALVLLAVLVVRLVANPWVLDYRGTVLGTFGWVLYGYGLPAAAMALAARLFGRDGRDLAATLCEIAAVGFGFLMVALQLLLWTAGTIHGGPWQLLDGGIQALWWAVAGALLLHRRVAASRPWARFAGTAALAAAAAVVFVWLLWAQTPLRVATPVGRLPLLNLLGLAYLAPALLFGLLALDRRFLLAAPWRRAAALACGALVFAWLTLEVRRAFAGSVLVLREAPGAAEIYAYSAVWIVYALALLGLGLAWRAQGLRHAALAVLSLTVLKVFLYDMSDLTGLYRVASFLGLGLSLIGIGRLYSLHVLRPAPAAPPGTEPTPAPPDRPGPAPRD